jgi:hypothetical protein
MNTDPYENLSVNELDNLILHLDKIRTNKVNQQQRFGHSTRDKASTKSLYTNPSYYNPYDCGYKPNPQPSFYSPHVDPHIQPHHRQIDTESSLRPTSSGSADIMLNPRDFQSARSDSVPLITRPTSKIIMSPRYDLQGISASAKQPEWLQSGVDLRAGQITRDSGIYR